MLPRGKSEDFWGGLQLYRGNIIPGISGEVRPLILHVFQQIQAVGLRAVSWGHNINQTTLGVCLPVQNHSLST